MSEEIKTISYDEFVKTNAYTFEQLFQDKKQLNILLSEGRVAKVFLVNKWHEKFDVWFFETLQANTGVRIYSGSEVVNYDFLCKTIAMANTANYVNYLHSVEREREAMGVPTILSQKMVPGNHSLMLREDAFCNDLLVYGVPLVRQLLDEKEFFIHLPNDQRLMVSVGKRFYTHYGLLECVEVVKGNLKKGKELGAREYLGADISSLVNRYGHIYEVSELLILEPCLDCAAEKIFEYLTHCLDGNKPEPSWIYDTNTIIENGDMSKTEKDADKKVMRFHLFEETTNYFQL